MRIFNYRLSRLPYFGLNILFTIFYFGFLGGSEFTDNENLVTFILFVSLIPFTLFVVLPRVRDCGWPPLVSLLTLVPFVSVVVSYGLLLVPSRYLFRNDSDLEDETD